MRDARLKHWSTRLSLTLALSMSSSALAQTEIPAFIQDEARRLIAQRTGSTTAEVQLVGAATVPYPLQGLTTYQFKGANTRGDLAGVTLDPTAKELSAAGLDAREDALRFERNGRSSTALLEALQQTPEDQTLAISLWAALPAGSSEGATRPPAGQNLSEAEVDAWYTQQQSWQKQSAAAATSPLVSKLAALGADAQADELSPLVTVSLKPSQIREVARWNEVVEADVAATFEAQLDVSRATTEADLVHAWGITGGTVRKAAIEVGGRVITGNPYLPPLTQYLPFSCFNVHANAVVGVLGSQHPVHRGIAPATTSPTFVGGDCFGSAFGLQSVTNVASSWNARAFNLSWGSQAGSFPGNMDRFYDNLVQNGWRTVVASAGNIASMVVASPSRGYNGISVGNYTDNGNVPWVGDTMHASSAWINPSSTFGGREKPELAAPGTNITTLNNLSPWISTPFITPTQYGTSLSAPHVTGVSTLMMQRNGSLAVWPEAVKSILMATAVHNIEGATMVSSRDGAGAVVATQADDVSRFIDGGWGALGYSCASSFTMDLATMPLWANRPARIVIAWDTNPSYLNYANRPSADIDLQVISPTNTVVGSSASWDNTFEAVEFTPTVAGPYKIRVIKYSCALTPKWLGWAWYQNH